MTRGEGPDTTDPRDPGDPGGRGPGRRRVPPSREQRASRVAFVRAGALALVLVVGVVVSLVAGPWSDDESERGADANARATPSESATASIPSAPPTTATPTVPQFTVPSVPRPTRTDAPGQAKPPVLPTLAQRDRRMAAAGFDRVTGAEVEPLTFRVASFNLLGASHTRGREGRKGYASGQQRLGPQLDALAAKGVTVAGLQESQQDQVRELFRRGGDWAVFPGLELGPFLADNSIMWRPSVWERVRTQTTDVPYFGGKPTPMPQVLLRHRATGRLIWVANFHNPADTRGSAAGFRQRAVEIEAALAKRLGADGTPVLLTGDMNDRERFACPFAGLSGMVSADGARSQDGRCLLPRSLNVDWIWGSAPVSFSAFEADRSVQDRRLTDHPLISADATLAGREDCRVKINRDGPATYCRT